MTGIKRGCRSRSGILIRISNMSLNKSALVLFSALLGLSCMQALPTQHQWEAFQENSFDNINPIGPLTARYDRDISMGPESFPEVLWKPHHDARPRFVDRSGSVGGQGLFSQDEAFAGPEIFIGNGVLAGPGIFAGNGVLSGPGFFAGNGVLSGPGIFAGNGVFTETGISTGNGVFAQPGFFSEPRIRQPEYETEKPQRRHISREDLLSGIHAIEKAIQQLTSAITLNEDEVTPNTVTLTMQPPVQIEPTVASEPNTIKHSEERESSSHTVTTLVQHPVLVETTIRP